jgi:hypothetical protein
MSYRVFWAKAHNVIPRIFGQSTQFHTAYFWPKHIISYRVFLAKAHNFIPRIFGKAHNFIPHIFGKGTQFHTAYFVKKNGIIPSISKAPTEY